MTPEILTTHIDGGFIAEVFDADIAAEDQTSDDWIHATGFCEDEDEAIQWAKDWIKQNRHLFPVL